MRKITTGMAVAVAGALLLSGCHGGNRPAGAAATPTGSVPTPASAPAPTTKPIVAAAIDGTLYYSDEKKYYRLDGSTPTVVLTGAGNIDADVSPDGKHVAYVLDNTDLMVANADGTHARRLRSHITTVGFGPTWSSDSSRLVVGRVVSNVNGAERWEAGTVRLSNGAFTALPKAIQGHIHYRLTGDSKRVFYADGRCSILSARVDGTGIKRVPVLGLDETAGNPRRLRACDIESLNADGSRMTVNLHVGNDTDGDIAGSLTADTVVETATGKVLPLPVHGTVRQVLYLSDDTLLVRSGPENKSVLTLLSADFTVLATKTEPASVSSMWLRDYAL